MQMTARDAALIALDRCTRDGAWSGLSIDNIIKKAELDRRESSLASRLVLGVLQNINLCDYYIDLYCSKAPDKLESRVLNVLRLGVYQLLFLDKIPVSAAVNESVLLCKKNGLARASGLVNAVLRRIAENKANLPEIPGKGTAEHLAIKYSHPAWLTDKLILDYGYDFAEGFFKANNMPAGLCIQLNTLKTTVDSYINALEDMAIKYKLADELPGCILLEGGNVTQLPGYDEGHFYVQDKAARTAVAIADPKPGMHVLDCCSAPGGKSFSAAIAMENKGSILSCDIHEKKLRLINSGAERLGIGIITTKARDAREDDKEMSSLFDVVIADVPCSGLGVIRKKPEIRNKTYQELSGLPKIQKDIIERVSGFVKPGGILLYSTCTILKEENECVVQEFLEKHNEFEYVDFNIGKVNSVNGMYTFWPHIDSTDGFFAAKLRRVK